METLKKFAQWVKKLKSRFRQKQNYKNSGHCWSTIDKTCYDTKNIIAREIFSEDKRLKFVISDKEEDLWEYAGITKHNFLLLDPVSQGAIEYACKLEIRKLAGIRPKEKHKLEPCPFGTKCAALLEENPCMCGAVPIDLE